MRHGWATPFTSSPRHWCFHELIPGHHLQGYLNVATIPYPQSVRTPSGPKEGALLGDDVLGSKTSSSVSREPHRNARCSRMPGACGRIASSSLSFHLEKMTPQDCIDFLVNRVGHDRDTQLGVRRSFERHSMALHQIAYLMAGGQF